jgi:3-dehydroquinate dehydratase-2
MASPSLSLLVLNGPNLNLLGTREPGIYGHATLADVEALCQTRAQALGAAVTCRQSNHEGQLVDWIHEARGQHQGLIVNAGAYTHTSIALADAIRGVRLPVVELHLSNVHAREAYRQVSYIAPIALGVIAGFGPAGYGLAIEALVGHLWAGAADRGD